MRQTHVVWHPHYDLSTHLPFWLQLLSDVVAPTPFGKYRQAFAAVNGTRGVRTTRPRLPTLSDLLSVHTKKYVHELQALADDGLLHASWKIHQGETSLDTDCAPFNAGLFKFFLASVGGTVTAMEIAVETKETAINLSGGFHHARASRGAGFCVLNDIAVATRLTGRRTLIVDLDVHHGDGTAELFQDDDRVFTFSMHQAGGYPDERTPSTIDVDLEDGVGDAQYLTALADHLPGCIDAFKPEVVLYVAGADPLSTDRLGALHLTGRGLSNRDQFVFGLCRDRKVPVAVTLGGGYSTTDVVAAAHVETCRQARSAAL